MWCSSTRGRARLVERLRWTAGSGKKGQFKVNLSQVHSPWSPLHVCVEHVERPASTQDTFTPPFVPPPPFTLTGRLKTPQTALTTKLLKGLRHEEIATWLCNSAFTTHLGITNHIRLRQLTGRSERKPSKVRTLAPTSAHQTCVFTLTFALRVLFLELSLDDSLARIPIAGSRVSLAASLRSRSCVLLDESLSSDLHRRPRPCPLPRPTSGPGYRFQQSQTIMTIKSIPIPSPTPSFLSLLRTSLQDNITRNNHPNSSHSSDSLLKFGTRQSMLVGLKRCGSRTRYPRWRNWKTLEAFTCTTLFLLSGTTSIGEITTRRNRSFGKRQNGWRSEMPNALLLN